MSKAKVDIVSAVEGDARSNRTNLSDDEFAAAKSFSGDLSFSADLPDESDNDSQLLKQFRADHAWRNLFNIPESQTIMIGPAVQKLIGVEVGINVSQEYPWKQLKFKDLNEHLFDEVQDGHILKNKFIDYGPEALVLIGYVPTLTQNSIEVDERDPFIVYYTPDATARASAIIQNIDIHEKWLLNKTLIKKPGIWLPQGSETDLTESIKPKRENLIDVELQSLFPISKGPILFTERNTNDVRDGYIELIPGDKRYENVFRKRIDCGIQAAPPQFELEQQTDPTFPTNSWSQYLYEINATAEALEPSSDEDDEQKQKQKGIVAEIEKPTKPMSKQVRHLLSSLEFNQVDMYRNDYPNISEMEVTRYTNPFMEEILCFADISKSLDRFVCGIDWYPVVSGLLTISYTFSTQATTVNIKDKTDQVYRALSSKNPVLMWSFLDSLHPKIEFEAPREVTALSFCPYSANILIGGTINGQITIWDLQDRVDKLDFEEMLTTPQVQYRVIMSKHLNWMKFIDEQFSLNPAVLSALDTSQNGSITSIQWLPTENFITPDGKMHYTPYSKNRFFISNSIDGTIAFWNLDINLDKKTRQLHMGANLPKQLCQSESPFKKYDGIFKPVFIVSCGEPLASCIYETAKFQYIPQLPRSKRNVPVQYAIKVTEIKKLQLSSQKPKIAIEPNSDKNNSSNLDTKSVDDVLNINDDITNNDTSLNSDRLKSIPILKTGLQAFLCGTFFGNVQIFYWSGFEFDLGNPVNKCSAVPQSNFANCHDGPILAIAQNPFCPGVFATVGRYVLAVWREDYEVAPVFWRKRSCEMTDIKWSLDRPAVLYLTRTDGFFEAWDILTRDDDTCLTDVLGGGLITAVSEHRPTLPNKIIGIGDYNSSFRLVVLPNSLQKQQKNEKIRFLKYIQKQLDRKKTIILWELRWFEQNIELRLAKKEAELKARQEFEMLKQQSADRLAEQEREAAENAEAAAAVVSKNATTTATRRNLFDLPARLEEKWDQLNLKRLLDVLMSRKMVNAEKLEKQTALEKSRLEYEKNKKTAVKKSFKRIDEDIANIRARILPTVKENANRNEIVVDSVNEIFIESVTYETVEIDCISFMNARDSYGDVDFELFFKRGIMRRNLLSKLLGSNTSRLNAYTNLKMENSVNTLNLGYKEYVELCEQIIIDESKDTQSELLNNYSSKFSDLDEYPTRESAVNSVRTSNISKKKKPKN